MRPSRDRHPGTTAYPQFPSRRAAAIESIIFDIATLKSAKRPFSLIFWLYSPPRLSHPFAT